MKNCVECLCKGIYILGGGGPCDCPSPFSLSYKVSIGAYNQLVWGTINFSIGLEFSVKLFKILAVRNKNSAFILVNTMLVF